MLARILDTYDELTISSPLPCVYYGHLICVDEFFPKLICGLFLNFCKFVHHRRVFIWSFNKDRIIILWDMFDLIELVKTTMHVLNLNYLLNDADCIQIGLIDLVLDF